MTPSQKFLETLNSTYFKLHKKYEDLFWISYMGDHSVDEKKGVALAARDFFRANPKYVRKIQELIPTASVQDTKRLKIWLNFFNQYQIPDGALSIKKKIDDLESLINKRRSKRKEGYFDPKTKKFVEASSVKMASIIATNSDEKIRKACFIARENLAQDCLDEYIALIGHRNEYARLLGYSDFYDFKVQHEDGMTKKELFSIFDSIYNKTRYAQRNIQKLEKKIPGILKPWNFNYLMSGDFTKEEDPYFQFDEALLRWGRSFTALGINFNGGKLQLDLIERKGKWNNGFCHWPDLVRYTNGAWSAGSANFTCNVVPHQIGSGYFGYTTLFHEGGHAAHFLHIKQREVCLSTEFAPMTASWAETQSMFLDDILNSMEWRSRYAKNAKGQSYPFELFERKLEKMYPLRPLSLHSLIFVCTFEKEVYEAENLTAKKVKEIARRNFRKYFVRSEDSLLALLVPHIYAWESTASYHGYGLATLTLHQWKEFFYEKYGYIVDNPNIGKEMSKVWKLGSSKKFKEFVVLATGKELLPGSFLRSVTQSKEDILKNAKERIAAVEKAGIPTSVINLNASIKLVHGKKEIANNKKSFDDMTEKYGVWLRSQQ